MRKKERREKQIVVMLTNSEFEALNQYAHKLKGTKGQVVRYALSKLENGNTRNTRNPK